MIVFSSSAAGIVSYPVFRHGHANGGRSHGTVFLSQFPLSDGVHGKCSHTKKTNSEEDTEVLIPKRERRVVNHSTYWINSTSGNVKCTRIAVFVTSGNTGKSLFTPVPTPRILIQPVVIVILISTISS